MSVSLQERGGPRGIRTPNLLIRSQLRCPVAPWARGAVGGSRTRYLPLTKRVHFQLCYDGMLWSWRESNPLPPACEAGALPVELQPHCPFFRDPGQVCSGPPG